MSFQDTTDDISEDLEIRKSLVKAQQPLYMEKKKNQIMFLFSTALLSFGALYNYTFQSNVKQQIKSQMNLSQHEYSNFVFIPTIPIIFLPILAGPALNYFGNRKGVFFFTFLMVIGMFLCILAINMKNYVLLIVGKTIHNIGSELIGMPQNYYYAKWFQSKNLVKVYTFGVLVNKVASCTSGIIYPALYDASQNLYSGLSLGLMACLLSFLSSIVVIYMDRKSEQNDFAQFRQTEFSDKAPIQKTKSFNLQSFKEFSLIFWLYVLQNILMFGSFYGFLNYLQDILTYKFQFKQTVAGELVSLPFWIAFTSPLIGILVDFKGRRIFGLILSSILAFGSVFYFFMLESKYQMELVVGGLVVYGVSVSLMAVFIYPTIPFLCPIESITIAVGIMLCFRNSGLCLLNYVGGLLMKDDNSGYDNYLMTYLIIFGLSVVVSVIIFLLDYFKQNGYLNSQKPEKYQKKVVISSIEE